MVRSEKTMRDYKNPFVKKVAFYTQKVLPLVFDNALSYYEALGHFCHKLNEVITAVNNNSMAIIEFEKELALALDLFENDLLARQEEFENSITTAFNDFKTLILAEWAAYKTELESDLEEFKNTVNGALSSFENEIRDFTDDISAQQAAFESEMTQRQATFISNITTQQNNFESTITTRQSNFETAQTARQSGFESSMNSAFTSFTNHVESEISDLESEIAGLDLGDPNAETPPPPSVLSFSTAPGGTVTITGAAAYINNGMGDNDYIRVYRNANVPEEDYIFVKRLHFADLATDTDIVDVTGDTQAMVIMFENPAIMGFFATRPGDFSLQGERSNTTMSAAVRAYSSSVIPTDPAAGDKLPLEILGNLHQIGYMITSSGTGLVNLTGNFDEGNPGKFLFLMLTNIKKNLLFRIANGSADVDFAYKPGYIYNSNSNQIIRDPAVETLLDRPDIFSTGTAIPANTDLDTYTTAGVYYCNQSQTVGTLTNKPSAVSAAFKLLVMPTTASNRFIQIISDNTATGTIYIRKTTTAGLSGWFSLNVTAAT